MKTNEAIQEAARYFVSINKTNASHCDIRLVLNELVDNDAYAQNYAVKRVQKILKAQI